MNDTVVIQKKHIRKAVKVALIVGIPVFVMYRLGNYKIVAPMGFKDDAGAEIFKTLIGRKIKVRTI